ncbi:hypothetical protein [Tenacibaculum aquimarinum]|uniref:hypothetical protein n=1 Tax=Tenacibaculum aquimarinum TaxID=2910675 RepID=UPI001F0AF777|nr:hypothetical protein [Tenacibaculum aquimarinum]
MTEETLFKYLNFLKVECSRHSSDKIINEDEINQLEIEIQKFKGLLKESKLSDYIINTVYLLNFDLNENNHNKPKFSWLKIFGGFYGKEYSEQINRKNRLEKLSNDIDSLIIDLKLN